MNSWRAYTPTAAAGTGTFTSVTPTGRYLLRGRVVKLQQKLVITTNGTAASYITMTLPVTAGASQHSCLAGLESQATGIVVRGEVTPSATVSAITGYDATYPGANGRTIVVSGEYEI
jgi:hypothetical protein